MLLHMDLLITNLVFLQLYSNYNECFSTHLQVLLLVFPLVLCLCLEVWFWLRQAIHRMYALLFELSSIPPVKNCELDHLLSISCQSKNSSCRIKNKECFLLTRIFCVAKVWYNLFKPAVSYSIALAGMFLHWDEHGHCSLLTPHTTSCYCKYPLAQVCTPNALFTSVWTNHSVAHHFFGNYGAFLHNNIVTRF